MKNCTLVVFIVFMAISPFASACDSNEFVRENYEEADADSWSEFGCKVVRFGSSLCYELVQDSCSQALSFLSQNPVYTMAAVGTILMDPVHAANCTGCAVCKCWCIKPSGYADPIGMASDIKQCYDMCTLLNKTYVGFKSCPQ